jgi:Kef-type K+ transport system membrane component KefB
MFLAEAAIILIVAKLAGELAARWDQPPVLGQLLAGLLLGLGLSFFDNSQLQAASVEVSSLANLGVVLLMFLAGLETDWEQLRATGRAAFVAASLGVAAPLTAGFGLALLFGLPPVESLFVGVILTATSVSITAQTLMELGSLQTIEGATVLGAAVIDDVIGLVVFSLVVALTGAGAGPSDLVRLVVFLFVFFALSATIMPWLISRLVSYSERFRGAQAALAIAIAIALLYGVAAERSGLAAITGAYMAGLLINRRSTHTEITEGTKVLTYGFFVPIFLVKTGMDARLDALAPVLLFVVATTLVAIVTKVVGCGAGARACGLSARQSLVVGVGMISRGEVALVVATLALSSGLISQAVFGASVVVVLATTVVTPPLLRMVLASSRVGNEPAPRIDEDTPTIGPHDQPVAPLAAHCES